MSTKLPGNVERGAKFLDLARPGWDKKINLRTLDMGHCSRCVLGQLASKPNGYYRMRTLLGLEGRESARHGFSAWGGGQTFEHLTESWKSLLKSRAKEAS